MTSRPPPQCLFCTNYVAPFDTGQGAKSAPVQSCAAFSLPAGIPDGVWWNGVDHRQPVSGDGGVRFKARPGEAFPDWAMADAG